jgi:glycosyltransferase involved in cell wall biosynthesis
LQPHHPKISVIMPVRNGSGYLDAAVASIRGQSFADFEFLVIDDGSTDGTPDMLRKHAAEDSRIAILNSGGAGIVAALNLGIDNATGFYIARMDADDIALPDRFELQSSWLDANPEIFACGTAATLINAEGKEKQTQPGMSGGKVALRDLLDGNPFIHPTMMIRRDALVAAGLYRAGCTYAEDYDLWIRLAENGPLANLPDITLQFRMHSGQTSNLKRLAQRAATALARQAAMRRFNGLAEGADYTVSLEAAVRQFLETRTSDPSQIGETEAKDFLVMARFAQQQAGRQWISAIESRIKRETGLRKAWLLPVWYRLDRLRT